MTYIICGFIFGCLIPYLARRLGKLVPAAPGYILLKIFVPSHYMPWKKLKNNPQYMYLFKRYLMRSLGWGIFTAAATFLFMIVFDTRFTGWYLAFLWILLLLAEIDKRFMLLPDVLTLPLLVLGFLYASQHGLWLTTTDPYFISWEENSALGAAAGYLMPLLASVFIVWKYPDAFGGGDIKLLCALGAWTGPEITAYIILGACIIFALSCLINRRRDGPFGPAIVWSALINVIFWFGLAL